VDAQDPDFDDWLGRLEAEADRVKRVGDWRQRQASELLLNINHARILIGRLKNGADADLDEIAGFVAKIKDLVGKISR
jgi:hypothetical protein